MLTRTRGGSHLGVIINGMRGYILTRTRGGREGGGFT